MTTPLPPNLNPTQELITTLLQHEQKKSVGIGAIVVAVVMAFQFLAPLLKPDNTAILAELEKNRAAVRELERVCAPRTP